MRKGFTLIELMIVLTILSILITMSMPTFNNMLLKSRSEEAKAVIQSIIFAQERYKQENGDFYPKINSTTIPADSEVRNERVIAEALKINLSKSNNFIYTIEDLSGTEDGNFTIKAILRDDDWNVCTTDTFSMLCKQDGSIDEDEWLSQYNRAEDKHYLEIRYPTRFSGTVTVGGQAVEITDFMQGGISYKNLYED